MDFFFNPHTVAVAGATPNPAKGGYAILINLLVGFKGRIYPVNPKYQEIEGLRCYPTIGEIPDQVDLVIIFVPAEQVLVTLQDCVAKGVKGVIIESSGFAETGPAGKERQRQLKEIADRTGIRIWGPNCMGIVDAVNGRVFSFMHPAILREVLATDRVSLIVQSGMLSAGFLVDIASNNLMGISKACSIGNKVDVNENDILPYLINDPETEVIALYLESFSDGHRFVELCRQSSKPIVLLKGGKSPQGAEAALSHTASLAGDNRLIGDILNQVNVVEAHEFKQMMDISRSLCHYSRLGQRPAGKAVAVITFSGGSGILACDFLAEFNIPLAKLSSTTRERLEKLFPPWMPVANPVDLWPAIEKNGADHDVYSLALEALLADTGVDAVFIHTVAGAFRIKFDLNELARLAKTYDKPVIAWIMGRRKEVFSLQQEAAQRNILAFPDLFRAAECLAACLNYVPRSPLVLPREESPLQLSPQAEELLNGATGALDEYASKGILRETGIITVEEKMVDAEADIASTIELLGLPVVMKGIKPDLIHKTEHGLVQMNQDKSEQVSRTYRNLIEKMGNTGRVLIQKQLDGRRELIAGYLRDPQFGPCVMIGLGGLMTEIIADRVFAAAPITLQEAWAMMERLKARKVLDGFRGSPPVDREALARILVCLGKLGNQYPRIKEIDINPLIISGGNPIAVDASIILDDAVKSPYAALR